MSFPIHPDDVESPRFGTWADDFNTYREACLFYGAEDPDILEAQAFSDDQQALDSEMDDMEARGGPRYYFSQYADDEIPF